MKILLLSPIELVKFADKRKFFKEDKKVYPLPTTQPQFFWYNALKKLGNEVEVFVYSVYTKKKSSFLNKVFNLFPKLSLGNRIVNKKILEKVKEFHPKLIIISGGTNAIFSETIEYIKKNSDTFIILINGMSPVLSATRAEKEFVKYVDYVFVNDKYHAIQWLELGAKNSFALPVSACNPEFHRKIILTDEEKNKYQCDVSFVGSLYPDSRYRDRVKILRELAEFNLGIWTPDDEIKEDDILRNFYRGKAVGEEVVKIINATKINLNIHSHSMQAGGNLRTFEIAGCGGFQIVDRVDPLWFKIGEEIVVFKDINDLKQKIRYYLNHEDERRKIAEASQRRAYKEHTYEKRFEKILQMLNI